MILAELCRTWSAYRGRARLSAVPSGLVQKTWASAPRALSPHKTPAPLRSPITFGPYS